MILSRNVLKIYWYLLRSFVIMGSVSFGGYLALIALVREKLVLKDKMIDDTKITDAIALSSILPGPLAVNVVAHVSFGIAGWPGAIISIIAVLLPSYLLVLLLSIFYFEFGSVIDFNSILQGIIPVVIGIIFSMSITMWKRICVSKIEIALALLSFLMLTLFRSYWIVVATIVVSGMAGVFLFKEEGRNDKPKVGNVRVKNVFIACIIIVFYLVARLYFLKDLNFTLFDKFATVSLTLFGGGYVMIPVLKTLLVDQLNWITSNEFFLGISFGQITPGPILISAVYFGYKVNGMVGSLVATLGIFLPSSMLVVFISHFYSKINNNWRVVSVLKGVRPAIVGLIIYSGFSLIFEDSLFADSVYLILLVMASLLMFLKFNISPIKAVIVGGMLGYLINLIFG